MADNEDETAPTDDAAPTEDAPAGDPTKAPTGEPSTPSVVPGSMNPSLKDKPAKRRAKQLREKTSVQEETKKGLSWVVIGAIVAVLLVLAGGGVAGAMYLKKRREEAAREEELKAKAPIVLIIVLAVFVAALLIYAIRRIRRRRPNFLGNLSWKSIKSRFSRQPDTGAATKKSKKKK